MSNVAYRIIAADQATAVLERVRLAAQRAAERIREAAGEDTNPR